MKRSHHVALLLMGTFAVGGGAYALMPRENCQPGIAVPSSIQGTECQPRVSSSGGGHGGSGGSSSRSGFFGGDGSSGSSSGTTSNSSSGVQRGGFGSFFAAHFSGGG